MDQHNFDEEKLAQLADFLSGEMSASEKEQLRRELASDKELTEKFQLLKQFRSHHQFQEREAKLRKAMHAPGQKYFRARPRTGLFRRPVLIGVAALILLVIVFRFFFQDANAISSLAAEYLSPPASLSTFRSDDATETEQAQRQILEFYEAGNYQEALALMEKIQDRFTTEHSSEYFFDLGILQLFANQPTAALGSFQQVKTGHSHDLRWYRAWALLFAGEIDSGKAILQELASNQNPFRDEARQLLRDLP